MTNRKPLMVAGLLLGTYGRRELWESEPAATYRDFHPEFGIDLPRGSVTVHFETGEILSHDDKDNVASRHGFFATLKGSSQNGR